MYAPYDFFRHQTRVRIAVLRPSYTAAYLQLSPSRPLPPRNTLSPPNTLSTGLSQAHGFHMLSTVLQRLPRPTEDLSGPVLGACLHLLHVVRFCLFVCFSLPCYKQYCCCFLWKLLLCSSFPNILWVFFFLSGGRLPRGGTDRCCPSRASAGL